MLLIASTKFQKLFNTKIYEIILLRCKILLCAWKTQEKDNNPSNNNTDIRSDMDDIVQFFKKVICITLHNRIHKSYAFIFSGDQIIKS